MSREQRIALLRQVVEERGQDATRALAQRRQVLDEAGERLNELLGYRDEYSSGTGTTSPGLGVQLQDYWRFMSRLNNAIADHCERVEQQKLAVEQSFQRWQESQQEVAVLDKVIDRIRARERSARERGEQRLLDELARSGTRRAGAKEV